MKISKLVAQHQIYGKENDDDDDDDDDVDLDTSDDEVRIKEQDLFMHVCLIMFCRKKLQGRKKEGV